MDAAIGKAGLTWVLAAVLALATLTSACAAPQRAGPWPKPKDADRIMGEYKGRFAPAPDASARAAGAKVIAEGGGSYRAILSAAPARKGAAPVRVELRGTLTDGRVPLAGKPDWKGRIAGGKLTAFSSAGRFALQRFIRKSPTEGLGPPAGAVVLLPYTPGKPTSLKQWTNPYWRILPDGGIQVVRFTGSNRTKRSFADCRVHVEFCIPYEPHKRGQGRGNSGVYLQSRYEVQVLDSFGLVPGKRDCGAIYGVAPPRVNACLPPLAWQTYDITFRAPRPAPGGGVARPGTMTVRHNGVLIHDRQKLPARTAGGARGTVPGGPLLLQDHGNPVRYRNIWLVEPKDEPPKPPGEK
jgi:hypothetical protein